MFLCVFFSDIKTQTEFARIYSFVFPTQITFFCHLSFAAVMRHASAFAGFHVIHVVAIVSVLLSLSLVVVLCRITMFTSVIATLLYSIRILYARIVCGQRYC